MISNSSLIEITKSREGDSGTTSKRDLLDLLLLLAMKRRFILVATLGVAAATGIVSMLLPPRYTAVTWVLPPQPTLNSANLLSQIGTGASALSALGGSMLGIKNPVDVYVAMFRSEPVEDAMIRRFNLRQEYKVKTMADARKVFEARSTAVAGLKDGIIRVTVEASSSVAASQMANAYVAEFEKLASGVAVTDAAQRRAFFDQQLELAKDKLSDAEQDLKRTELTTGLIEPDNQSRAMIESAATVQGEIAAKQVQLQGMSAYATDNNPDVIVLRKQISELRAQLGGLTGNRGSESDLFVPKGRVPTASLDYVRKLREVKYRETIFQAIANQFELAKLDEAKQGAVFQVIEPATPPEKRSFPHRTILVLVFTFAAFVFSCLAVWASAVWKDIQLDPEDGPRLAAILAVLGRRRV